MKRNLRGIYWFVALAYLPVIIYAIALNLAGININMPEYALYRTLIVFLMFMPSIAAFVVRKFITKEGFKEAYLKFGNWKEYLKTAIIIPLIFIVIYLLTSIFYKPDLSLNTFIEQYDLPELPVEAPLFIVLIFISTLIISPLLNFIPSFGEEFGWRGYLLPKLLFLGERKALILSSFIWACWHLPLILFTGFGNFPNVWIGSLLYIIVVTCLGIYIGAKTLDNKSVYLASFMHGVFNAQSYGIWPILFTTVNPLVGGIVGLLALPVFLILALYHLKRD